MQDIRHTFVQYSETLNGTKIKAFLSFKHLDIEKEPENAIYTRSDTLFGNWLPYPRGLRPYSFASQSFGCFAFVAGVPAAGCVPAL